MKEVRKLEMTCLCVLICTSMAPPVFASQYQIDVTPETKDFQTAITIPKGTQITIDIYLSGLSVAQNSGGVWLNWSGSTELLAYNSAGRALTDGSEGPIGDWIPGGGSLVPDAGGPGTLMMVVVELGSGAAPDGDGDLIIGRVTFDCIGAGDASVTVSVIPGTPTWGPESDSNVRDGILTITQEGEGCIVDADCDDNLWCTGVENCVDGVCQAGGDPCPGQSCSEAQGCYTPPTPTTTPPTPTTTPPTPTTTPPPPPPSKTTTTTIAGQSTTTTTIPLPPPVQTTTTLPGICFTELIYGEHSEEVELLRHFRDNVLSQTSEGQEIIRLYYEWSPIIVQAMENDAEFKEEVKEMVDGVLMLIGGVE